MPFITPWKFNIYLAGIIFLVFLIWMEDQLSLKWVPRYFLRSKGGGRDRDYITQSLTICVYMPYTPVAWKRVLSFSLTMIFSAFFEETKKVHDPNGWNFDNDINRVECQGDADKMKALHKKLLDGYDPLIRPSSNYSNPTVVTVQLHVTVVLGLNALKQLIFLRAFLKVAWKDEFLQWNPKEFGGIDHTLLPQNRIWKPDLILYNSANEHDSLGSDEMLLRVNSKGHVSWDPIFYLEGSCKLDMSHYPYDVSVCPVVIHAWLHDNTTVTLRVPDEPVNLKYMVINGEYEISSDGALKFDEDGYDELHFQLRLTRRPLYICLSVMLPINLLATLSIVPFILPPEESAKVDLSMTVLLAFTVILDVVDEKVPHTSDNFCILVVYIALLLILSLLSVLGNAIVVAIRCWDETADNESPKSITKSHSFRHNVQKDDIEEKTNIYGPRSHDLTEVDNVSTSSSDVTKTMVKTGQKCLNFFQWTRAAKVNTGFGILALFILISIQTGITILYIS